MLLHSPYLLTPSHVRAPPLTLFLFSYHYSAATELYTLSLHDALPIYRRRQRDDPRRPAGRPRGLGTRAPGVPRPDRKSTRLNSSHITISYAVFCLKKKKI